MPRRLIAIALACAAWSCHRAPGERVIVAEEAMLRRQIAGLRGLIAQLEKGPLLPEDKLVVAVAERLVQDIVKLGLPRELTLQDTFRVRAETAEVRFRDDLASIRLDGRVSLLAELPTDVFAELSVYSALDQLTLDPATGTLRGKVKLIAFEVRQVGGVGQGRTAQALIERLGREQLEAFSELAPDVDIPVRIEQQVVLKGLGDNAVVSALPAQVPLTVTVSQLIAAGGQLWVILDAQTGPWSKFQEPAR
jgi:hypothetical protein